MSASSFALDGLAPVVERFVRAIVCCAGDVMLDRFVYGNVSRISPEAPVPVLHIREQHSMLGGAGNAVRNLHALACAVRFFSVVGDDAAAGEIETVLCGLSRCEWFLERDAGRQTIIKTRFIADAQQIMRADAESSQGAGPQALEAVLARFTAAVGECSVALFCYYGKGLLTGSRAQQFIRAARDAEKPVIVDPKGSDFRRYNGATVIKPNLRELAEAAALSVTTEAAQEAAARALLAHVEVEYLLVTCGAA